MWFFGPLPLGAQQVTSAALGSNSVLLQQTTFTRADHTTGLTDTGTGPDPVTITASAGTAKPDRSVAIVAGDENGLFAITETGTLTYVVLSGGDVEAFPQTNLASFEQGTVVANRSRPLSGSEIASAQETRAPTISPTTLVSQLIQPAAGTVTYVVGIPGDVTVNIGAGEMEINSFIGSVLPKTALTGTASAAEAGSVALGARTEALTGSGFTTGQGNVAVQQDVEDTYIASSSGSVVFTMVTALTGTQVVMDHGTVTASADITIPLTGEASNTGIGDVVDSLDFALTGIEILGEQAINDFGLPLNIALSGAESLTEAGTVFLDNDRSYPLTGTEALVQTTNPGLFVNAFVNGEAALTEQYLFETVVELSGTEILGEQGQVRVGKKNDDAGKPEKPPKDKKKKKVTDDGQVFEVNDEELQDLIAVAREIAVAKAKEEADAAVAAKSTEKIKLTVPKVTGSEELKDAIADIYMQATIDAEVSRNRQLDEEEALVLLLLN
jgi:hypothetical protein